MRLLQLLTLLLLATAARADQIDGFLECSAAGIFEGEFVFPPDLGLIGDAGSCASTIKPGEPNTILWDAVFPLQVSEVFTDSPGETDAPWSFSAEAKVSIYLPSTGNLRGIGTEEFGVGVHSEITGEFCPFDSPCVPFSREGEGMGWFIFTSDPGYCGTAGAGLSCLVEGKVGLFEVPEPASLWLLATAAGIALLLSRSGRIAHNFRLWLTFRATGSAP